MGAELSVFTKHRLSENPGGPTVFVIACDFFFTVETVYHVFARKSNVFPTKYSRFCPPVFGIFHKTAPGGQNPVDKRRCLCLNAQYNINNDDDGNLPFREAAESRRLVRAGVEGLGILIPESVPGTRLSVVGPGCPRYGLGL